MIPVATAVLGLLIVALDVWASCLILRSEAMSVARKVPWFALIWLVPFLGAVLALQVTKEERSVLRQERMLSGSHSTYPPGIGDVGADAGASGHHDS